MWVAHPVHAVVSDDSKTPVGTRILPSGSYGMSLFYDQPVSSNKQMSGTREWIMQNATVRGTAKGSAAASTNATRIVLPAGGAQNTVGADAPLVGTPTLPSWAWALIPISVTVVLAAILILRTIFGADEEDVGVNVSRTSRERVVPRNYEERSARTIPIKGSEEPSHARIEREQDRERRGRRIHIDESDDSTNPESTHHR